MKHLLPLQLGLRLLRGQGRTGLVRIALMVGGTAIGVILLLIAMSVEPTLHARDARLAARSPVCAAGERLCGLGDEVHGRWGTHDYVLELVDAPSGTPAPAGLSRLPRPGEIVLSPALRRLATRKGNELLRQRIPGAITGTVGNPGLLQPDELFGYVGVGHLSEQRHLGQVVGYGAPRPGTVAVGPVGGQYSQDTTPQGRLDPRKVTVDVAVVVLLLPVLLFLGACARLSARTRDQRLAALRLVGMGPLQTRLANAVETGVAATAGALTGLAGFELLGFPLARLELDGRGWFRSDAQPSLVHVLELMVATPLLAVVVATLAVRGTTGRLAGSHRTAAGKRLGWWRLLPLVAGAAALLVVDTHRLAFRNDVGFVLAGLGAAIVGLAVGIPLLAQLAATLLARLTGSLSLQLGARRLQADAPAVGRVVTGLVLLVFTAGLVQSILIAVHREVLADANPWSLSLRPSVVEVPGYGADRRPVPPGTWSRPGVLGLVGLPTLSSGSPSQQGDATVDAGPRALVATCADLDSVLGAPIDGCREGTPTWFPDVVVPDQPLVLHSVSMSEQPAQGPAVTIPSPRDQLQSGFPDALSNTFGVQLLLPPTTPGLSQLGVLTPLTYLARTDGSARATEELRTAAAQVDPTLQVSTAAEIRAASSGVSDYHFALYSDLINGGSAVALLLAFASVAVTTADRAVERRRHLALQTAVGVPVSTMRRAQLAQVLLPYGIGIACAASLSVLAGLAYTNMVLRGARASVPWNEVLVVAAGAVGGAVVVALSVLPAIGRPLTSELLRRE